MSAKRRVYEVARELEMDNKALLSVLKSLDVPDVKNHMSVLSADDEVRVRRHLGQGAPARSSVATTPEPEQAGAVQRRVVVRRRKVGDGEETSQRKESSAEDAPMAASSSSGSSPTPVRRESETHFESRGVDFSAAHADASSVAADAKVPEQDSGPEPLPEFIRPEPPSRPPVVPTLVAARAPAEVEHAVAATELAASPFEELAHSEPATALGGDAASGTFDAQRPSTAPGSTAPGLSSTAPGLSSTAPGLSSTAPGLSSTAPGLPSTAPGLPSTAPKRGIDVWEGRPGVPMHNHRPGPRRVQYDAKAPAPGNRRGPGGRMMRGGPRQRGIGSFSKGRGGGPVTKERNAHKKVVRIEETVTLQTLAGNMGVKTGDMLRQLFSLGLSGININSTLDADTAKIIGAEFGWEVEDVAVSEEEQLQKAQGTYTTADAPEDLRPRPPVVTVMGHVDHGKTSLLDAMRQTNIVQGESGGITQHIGAYSVNTPSGKVTFLDTPGHAAFTQMRARGTKATDVVVLVVAADDGVMPQTKEAIQHARAAEVPIIVAINKCDKPDAQPERVRREVSEQGLVPEEWGGDTLFCEVSAHTKQGLPDLLEKLALQAEVLELQANPDKPASGIVVESQLDRGRGPVATILVREGTLRPGDVVLAGAGYGKVRAMQDWAGKIYKEAGPSEPVSIIGLSEVPRAGDQVYVVKDLKTAQAIAETRKVKERRSLAPSAGNKPRTLDEIALLMKEAEQLELKVIVKADVGGSAEAVSESLVALSTEKVRVSVVLQAAGAITENDVNLAVAAGAIIVGFNVKPAGKAASVAQREGIEIRQYSIIYNVIDDVKLAMEGMLAPKLVEKEIGKAEVRQTFRITKAGTIAGCMITSGVVRRGAHARLIRAGEQVWEGKISGLKRFKEDVKEVKDGFECGISLEDMNAVHVEDIIEVYEMEEVKQSL